ncbi:MAG TPA: metallophosphoesterase [Chthoniobacterales bacterium]|nr:metallophosphoesterase [Chthoniobacterales bacterium]
MSLLSSGQAAVADNVVLDGRLALFHQKQRWLAVADLHFGYELSQRAAGRLLPLWGMNSIEQRLLDLLADYRPRRLLILGDLVHDRAAAAPARELLARLGAECETIVLAGNHDRALAGAITMAHSWQSEGFHFHHGHCAAEATERVQIIGHHHPTGSVSDGAGLRLKLPAFVQQDACWIMPAFSPWAAGVAWAADAESRIWLCTPGRILRLPQLAVRA